MAVLFFTRPCRVFSPDQIVYMLIYLDQILDMLISLDCLINIHGTGTRTKVFPHSQNTTLKRRLPLISRSNFSAVRGHTHLSFGDVVKQRFLFLVHDED